MTNEELKDILVEVGFHFENHRAVLYPNGEENDNQYIDVSFRLNGEFRCIEISNGRTHYFSEVPEKIVPALNACCYEKIGDLINERLKCCKL